MFCKTRPVEEDENDRHEIQKGDHLIRWTNLLVVPVQVHAICISASEESITIVDFGLTEGKNGEMQDMSDVILDEGDSRALMEAAAKHKSEIVGPERISIRTLHGQEEIRQWKKVEYGKQVKKKKWFWKRNKNDETRTEENGTVSVPDGQVVDISDDESEEEAKEEEREIDQDDTVEITKEKERKEWWFWKKKNTDNKEQNIVALGQQLDENTAASLDIQTDTREPKTQPVSPPTLPKSDPTNIVLARLRYLLTNPHVLPPHHILFSNSECIAVWVKTGRWSTIQASIFLQSTLAGNIKTTATVAATLASTTTSVTVPAAGVWGWMGMTTTTQVGLFAAQPWLIPVVAGVGIVYVGTPLVVLQKSRKQWDKVTQNLTTGFWEWAPPDVYIEAIKSWSTIQ